MKPRIILAGAGGHGLVVADLIAATGRFHLAGFVDRSPDAAIPGLRSLGSDERLAELSARGLRLAAVGVGGARDTAARESLWLRLRKCGLEIPALIHPGAIASPSASFSDGVQAMARAVVNPGATIGVNVVLNTGCVIEHECRIGAHAFIGPGAVLGGNVEVGDRAFVGLGAIVLPGVSIGAGALVGAGAVVTKNVPPKAVVVGIPAAASGAKRARR